MRLKKNTTNTSSAVMTQRRGEAVRSSRERLAQHPTQQKFHTHPAITCYRRPQGREEKGGLWADQLPLGGLSQQAPRPQIQRRIRGGTTRPHRLTLRTKSSKGEISPAANILPERGRERSRGQKPIIYLR